MRYLKARDIFDDSCPSLNSGHDYGARYVCVIEEDAQGPADEPTGYLREQARPLAGELEVNLGFAGYLAELHPGIPLKVPPCQMNRFTFAVHGRSISPLYDALLRERFVTSEIPLSR